MSISSPPGQGSSDPPSEPPPHADKPVGLNGHSAKNTTNSRGDASASSNANLDRQTASTEAVDAANVATTPVHEDEDEAPDAGPVVLPLPLTPDWVAPAPPQFVVDLAESCAKFVERSIGVRPDFTSDTLSLLDHYLAAAGANVTERPEAQALVAHSAAAYFGEVIRRRFLAWWEAPSSDPSTWELRFHDVFLSFSPLSIVYAAMVPASSNENTFSAFEVDEADQEEVAAYLANLPGVPEDQFYLPSTRFDTLESIVEMLRALARSRGLNDVFFTDEDYGD
jgi:hypothetical protein